MKLKSLLLGSAAALALSTGAQAADPIANFVSLGVCDAYGISGLTIESDDTCLKISGKVAYEYRVTHFDGFPTLYDTGDGVDWNLRFEAVTQTDAGAARAVLRLAESGVNSVIFDRAYVQFGDTTVLTAGRNGSIFSTTIQDNIYGSRHEDFIDFWNFDNNEIDKGNLANTVRTGGESIQIESLIADGFSVLVALEDLGQTDLTAATFDPLDPDFARGTFGLAVAYDANGISAEAGILIGDLYDNVIGYDPINYYLNVSAEFDAFTARGGFVADDTGYWIASLGADATFDMFSLKADVIFDEVGDWTIAGEGSFAATDSVDVFIGAAYSDETASGFVESFTVYGGAEFGVTENISARAQIGYIDFNTISDTVYGEIGAVYKPGGGFEAALDLTATTDGDYQVTFSTSKSF